MSSPFVKTPSYSALVNPVPEAPLNSFKLAVKDLFHMSGLPTAAGNPDWLATHPIPTTTNTTVEQLLEAGCIFAGKTITDELAYSLHGQNKHYAPLVNPAAPTRIPGGSSSGSAVAVTSHLADVGLGTDTGGSIRVPASYQGLWGLRTTQFAILCDNMVPLAPSFDTIGWMTRDLNTMQKVTTTCFAATENTKQGDNNDPIKKIGVIKALNSSVAHSALIAKWLESLNLVTEVSLVPVELDPTKLQTAATFRVLQGAEIWQQHGEWISQTSPDIAEDIRLRFDWCKTISNEDILKAKAQQQIVVDAVDNLFAQVDAILIPTTPGPAPRCDASTETLANDRNALLAMTAIAGLVGLPQLHMPLFSVQDAPCGMSLIGKRNSELALIKTAKQLTEGK